MRKRFFSAALLCAALFMLPARAAGLETPMDAVVGYELVQSGAADAQSWLSGALAEGAGEGTEWFVLALSQYGDYDFSTYAAALEEYTEENTVVSAASRERLALAFLASGYDSPYLAGLVDGAAGQQGLMSWVFALHLLRNGAPSAQFTEAAVIEKLLSLQQPGGGWAVTGHGADTDATAMAVQALAPYVEEDAAAAAAVERAVACLAALQQPDGGFQSFGQANSESAAQVVTALAALGIDCCGDERFLKEGRSPLDALLCYQRADGSFSHLPGGESSDTATAQAFYALVALWRCEQGRGGLYELDRAGALQSLPVKTAPSGRTLWTLGVLAAFLLLGGLLYLRGKRSWKSYALLAVLLALALWGVWRLDIQKPQAYYGAAPTPAGAGMETTLTIRCDTVAGERDFLPANGVLLETAEILTAEGATAYEQLVTAARLHSLPLESEGGSGFGSAYVSGIGYLYEFEFGELSGWMYRVNGVFAEVGCGEYALKPGDAVEWLYTRDLGRDLGAAAWETE